MPHVAIIGTVGVPACYGGFETLAEQLIDTDGIDFTVVCSSPAYPKRAAAYRGARLLYLPLKANGWQSMFYDAWAILAMSLRRVDTLLVLGVSGSFALPVARLLGRKRIVTNIDGLEWQRAKWSPPIASLLRRLEAFAVRFSDVVITDNRAISDYVRIRYGIEPVEIAYGGDHAVAAAAVPPQAPPSGPFVLAVSRIEPENNVEMILETFASELGQHRLVYIGNWDGSDFGRELRRRYATSGNIALLDPIYDQPRLYWYRQNCALYLHGHSAGGSNPSLIEAMHAGRPVAAFDVVFNRHTMLGRGYYFSSRASLAAIVRHIDPADAERLGRELRIIAERDYSWAEIRSKYYALIAPARAGERLRDGLRPAVPGGNLG